MRFRVRILGVGALTVITLMTAMPAQALTLGKTANRKFFTLDGVPTYLNGISYYAAQSINTPTFRTQDLDDMVADGFNWIRVWAYWDISGENCGVTTSTGTVREPYMTRLKTLITEANNRGMIVDVSMRHETGSSIAPGDLSQHVACAQTIATQLLPYRNIYIDIANERDVGDSRFVSLPDCGTIIDAIKAIDPNRLCTASGGPTSQTEMNNFKVQAHLDFMTPHLCRDASCPAQTLGTVNLYVSWMTANGFRMPVHMQEPLRRSYNPSYNPVQDDFYRDDTGAKIAEAAGWCLHNGSTFGGAPYRSFDMSDARGRLYSQLDSVELDTTNNILDRIGSTSTDIRKYQAEYAEQLSHQIGRRESTVWSASVSLDPPGYLVTGPSIDTVPAGNHRVDWRLSIDNNSANNEPVVILDVVSNAQILATRAITRQEFTAIATAQTFSVNFTSTGQQDLEFRVNWLDKAYIQCDWVQLNLNLGSQGYAGSPSPSNGALAVDRNADLGWTAGSGATSHDLHFGTVSPPPLVTNQVGTTYDPGALASNVIYYWRVDEVSGSGTTTGLLWTFTTGSFIGDFDFDDDVDIQDFAHLQLCFSGPGVAYAAGCANADLNADGDVDQSDFAAFLPCMNGPNLPPGC